MRLIIIPYPKNGKESLNQLKQKLSEQEFILDQDKIEFRHILTNGCDPKFIAIVRLKTDIEDYDKKIRFFSHFIRDQLNMTADNFAVLKDIHGIEIDPGYYAVCKEDK